MRGDETRYIGPADIIGILAAGCMAFGALFFAGTIGVALAWHNLALAFLALVGCAVTYLSYFAQSLGVPRVYQAVLVIIPIVVGIVVLYVVGAEVIVLGGLSK